MLDLLVALRPAEERLDAAVREGLPEHAPRAQHAPRLGPQPFEPRLHHREHRLREALALAVGRRADQLLQVERVARGPLHEPRHHGVRHAVSEHLAHKLLAPAARQRTEPERVDHPLLPEVREHVVDLRARQREHHEGLVVQRPQHLIDQLDARNVPPVQVLQHEEQR